MRLNLELLGLAVVIVSICVSLRCKRLIAGKALTTVDVIVSVATHATMGSSAGSSSKPVLAAKGRMCGQLVAKINYVCSMDTMFLKLRREAKASAKQQHLRDNEISKVFTAGALVIAGLIVAVLYRLLTHQIAV
jgi:hypothetical protein